MTWGSGRRGVGTVGGRDRRGVVFVVASGLVLWVWLVCRARWAMGGRGRSWEIRVIGLGGGGRLGVAVLVVGGLAFRRRGWAHRRRSLRRCPWMSH